MCRDTLYTREFSAKLNRITLRGQPCRMELLIGIGLEHWPFIWIFDFASSLRDFIWWHGNCIHTLVVWWTNMLEICTHAAERSTEVGQNGLTVSSAQALASRCPQERQTCHDPETCSVAPNVWCQGGMFVAGWQLNSLVFYSRCLVALLAEIPIVLSVARFQVCTNIPIFWSAWIPPCRRISL